MPQPTVDGTLPAADDRLPERRTRQAAAREGQPMISGPLEVLVVAFPDNRFTGDIAPALRDLVDAGTIRIVDLAVVTKDADGRVRTVMEGDPLLAVSPDLLGLLHDGDEIFSEEDLDIFGAALEPNSTGALFIFENVWEARLADAVGKAHGQVVLNHHLPHAVTDALAAAVN